MSASFRRFIGVVPAWLANPPFTLDYGVYIRIGRNGFVNYGCVFLNCNLITIGDDAQIGPGVHIYTAFHPVDA